MSAGLKRSQLIDQMSYTTQEAGSSAAKYGYYFIAAYDATDDEKAAANWTAPSASDDAGEVANSALSDGVLHVRFSSGTHGIGTSIVPVSYSKVDGVNNGATTLKLNASANCDVIKMSDDNTHRYNVVVRDLSIDGNNDNNTSGSGMVMYAAWYSRILNVRIKDMAEKGIYYGDAGDAGQHAVLRDIDIATCKGTGLHFDHGVTDAHIGPVWVYDCGQTSGSNAIFDTSGGTKIYHLHCSPSPDSGESNVIINGMEHMTIHGLQIADDLAAANGLEIYADASYAMYARIDGGYIHNEASATHTGYGLYLRGTIATNKKVYRNQISGLYVDGYAYSCYIENSKCEDNRFTDNRFANAATAAVSDSGTRTYFFGNYGHIGKGEIRTYSGTLAGVTPAGIMLSVDNPFGQAVRVLDVDIDITTQGAGSGTMCVGVGSSATTDYATIFSVLPCDPGTSYPYFYRATKTATYGVLTSPINWATGSGNRYLNFYAHAANNGLVATYTVTVMGV